jgi:hypothetical protein
VISFLRKRNDSPSSRPLLSLCAKDFHMFHLHGTLLVDSAMELLSKVLPSGQSTLPQSRKDFGTLFDVVELFTNASEAFHCDNSVSLAAEALAMSSLVALQVKLPMIRVVNLSLSHARSLLFSLESAQDAVTVAMAYSLNDEREWILPIFNQVIQNSNFEYFSELRRYICFSNNIFAEMATLYNQVSAKTHAQFLLHFPCDPPPKFFISSTQKENILKFISLCADLFIQYELATKSGLSEAAEGLRRTIPGLRALVKL